MKWSGVCLAFLMLSVVPVSSAVAQDFTIESYDVGILIAKDSSFTVTETIRVLFHRPRHGIYRDIPFRYTDSIGREVTTPTKILSVTDDSGGKLTKKVMRIGNTIRVRIGDADRYVTGYQTYVIFYRVENALLYFEDHDELYWNVTGNQWQAPIKNVRCSVSLEGSSTSQILSACYTGRSGSTETACSVTPGQNNAEFSGSRQLAPGEGLTIAFGWDKGLVTPPSPLQRFLWAVNLQQNWVFFLPFVSLFVMVSLWWRTGKDPRVRDAVMVQYEPPQHGGVTLNPAEVGALVDERLDPRDITATIVGLAVNGYIRIEETEEEGIIFKSTDYYLKKLKEPDRELTPFERQIMQDLLGASSGKLMSDLKNSFYVHLDGLKKDLYGELVKKKYFTRSPEKIRQAYTRSALLLGGAVGFGLFFLFGDLLGEARPIIAAILTASPILAFSRIMPAKTRIGASAYMNVLGFQEFLNKAEKDRLERMKDENLFSKYFPYALALDVADNWAKAFEGIYQTPPEWYVSPGGFRTFSPSVFSRSVNSAVSSISTAMYSAPRGSGTGGGGGFGGGGSSGGGFGGGGGGSW